MAATNVETLTTPRDSLPNVYSGITAREIDFVTRFGTTWESLREVLGIMRPVRKAPGSTLVSYTASVALESGNVPAGAVIPYSKATIAQSAKEDLELQKYAKAVPIEDVNKYGAEIAVQKSDDAFLNELQSVILDDFYGEMTGNTSAMNTGEATFQMAVSMAIGLVRDKFKRMRKNASNIVVFVNTLDAYRYLGSADISVQNAFGIDYIKNFLGATTLILSSEIDEGEVIAVPADNLVLYYIDPADGEFAQLGLTYTVDGETNLIGFHANGNYTTAVGESFALMGMKLWYEYADAVAIIYIGTVTKVTTAETITADSVDTKLYKTAHSPVISVQELKDGSTALVEGTDFIVEKNGVRLKNTPSGTVTIKYTYVAQA